MAFDPDAYARGDTPAFDPDAYARGNAPAPAPAAPTPAPAAAGPSDVEKQLTLDNFRKLMAPHGDAGSPRSTLSAYTNRLKDAVTSGLARPLGGVMSVAGGEIGELFGGQPATAGERWRAGVNAEDMFAKAMEERSKGVVGSGVSLLGSLASGGRSTATTGLGAQVLQSGAQGAVEGAARNAEDVGSAAGGAAVGGGLAAGATGVLGALVDRAKRVGGAVRDIGEASRGGTSQSLAHEAGALFDRLDNAGIHFGGRETPALANGVNNALAASAYSRNVPEAINGVVREVNERVATGAMTYGDVRKIQTQLSDLRANPDPGTRALAGALSQSVDDFMRTARPTMPASSVGTVSMGDLDRARNIYSRASTAGEVEHALTSGTRLAPDPTQKLKQNAQAFTDEARAPGAFSAANPEQLRLMDRIVAGQPGKERLAKASDWLATGIGGAGALGGVGGYVAPLLGGPDVTDRSNSIAGAALATAAALKGGSSIMRRQLAEAAAGKMDDVMRNIVTGATAQGPGTHVPRNALALLLAKQELERGGGKVASSFVDDRERGR